MVETYDVKDLGVPFLMIGVSITVRTLTENFGQLQSTKTVKSILWVHNFLAKMYFPQPKTTVLREDSQECVVMVTTHIVTGRNLSFYE